MFRGFLFCSVFNLCGALLAHFNWLVAIKIRCIYVTYWKSFDLLWLWMHFFLCSCFKSLRRENYKVIWFNLLKKKCTTHRAYTLKEIFEMTYGYGHGTEAEVELERIDTAEKRELKERAIRKNSRQQARQRMRKVVEANTSQEVDLSADTSSDEEVDELIEKGIGEQKQGWKAANIRSAINSKLQDLKTKAEAALLLNKPEDIESGSLEEAGPSSSNTEKKEDTWLAVKGFVQKVASPRTKRAAETKTLLTPEEPEQNVVYILTPDYSNEFDLRDPRKAHRRERRDRRLLRKRVRERVRIDLLERANEERKRKLLTDAIDLLLQLFRLVTMLALVLWNVRKHNPIASFKHVEIDFDENFHRFQLESMRGRVDYYWVVTLSYTVFLDYASAFVSFLFAYYQQLQLLRRMGLLWSLLWGFILVSVSVICMILPMSYLMESMEVSWCRVLPHTEMACWVPPIFVDFEADVDPSIKCNWVSLFEGSGHRSPGNYSDFVNFSDQPRRFFFF